jgi:hypothetical protein
MEPPNAIRWRQSIAQSCKSLSRRERVTPIARWAAGEGYKKEKALKKFPWYPSPGPLARATLSRRERDFVEDRWMLD